MVHGRLKLRSLVKTTELLLLAAWNSRMWEDYPMVRIYCSTSSKAYEFHSSEIIQQTTEYCKARRDHHLAYFFFSFRETEKQKASNLPRSILAQLLEQAENIPTALQTFYDKYQHGEPSESGVLESIQALLVVSHIYIIIDALDECPNAEEERAELCNILKEVHSWANDKCHVLVTSRKEADLTEALLPIVAQEPISIQGSVVDTDIQKFVRTQLQTNSKLSKWSKEIQAEIEQTLVKKSGGM
jgi:hypothetical protein